jgi:hypothetical protein
MAGVITTEADPLRPTRRWRPVGRTFIQFISRVHKSEPIGSREHDNIVDRQLGDREWRAVHKMVVVRSHWPCRLRDRGGSQLVARIWRPTSPDVVPPLDRQFNGMREVRKVRKQARILSLSPCLAAAPCPPDPADANASPELRTVRTARTAGHPEAISVAASA